MKLKTNNEKFLKSTIQRRVGQNKFRKLKKYLEKYINNYEKLETFVSVLSRRNRINELKMKAIFIGCGFNKDFIVENEEMFDKAYSKSLQAIPKIYIKRIRQTCQDRSFSFL